MKAPDRRVTMAALCSRRGRRPCTGLLVATLMALAACSGLPPAMPVTPSHDRAPAPITADQRANLPGDLAIEQRWLKSWFKGTPVRIVQNSDGSLSVAVPREFCFDRGRSDLKPALAAVLDKVAESLRRRPQAQLLLLAAPPDVNGDPSLALQRAARVQDHLRQRGIDAARLVEPAVTNVAAVQLQIGASGR